VTHGVLEGPRGKMGYHIDLSVTSNLPPPPPLPTEHVDTALPCFEWACVSTADGFECPET